MSSTERCDDNDDDGDDGMVMMVLIMTIILMVMMMLMMRVMTMMIMMRRMIMMILVMIMMLVMIRHHVFAGAGLHSVGSKLPGTFHRLLDPAVQNAQPLARTKGRTDSLCQWSE